MKRVVPRLRPAAFTLFGLFLLALLLRNADIAMDGVKKGLSVCTNTLLPSLFPFMVLSSLLVAMGAASVFSRLFSRPVWYLFGLSGAGCAAYLLGAVCGFPTGVTAAVAMRRRGEISAAELRHVALFANTPSSGFLVGAVGEALFGNRGAGTALFLITLTSAALTGILLRVFCGPPCPAYQKKAANGAENPLIAADFANAVKGALFSFFQVAAFVMFFSCVTACLSPALAAAHLPAPVGVLVCGMLEMTAGISAAVTALSPAAAFRFCAFFAGFSGLCICLQLFAVAEGEGLRASAYLLSKTLQGGLNLLLAECYLRVCRPSFLTASGVFAGDLARAVPHTANGFFVWIALGVCLILMLAVRGKKKKRSVAAPFSQEINPV